MDVDDEPQPEAAIIGGVYTLPLQMALDSHGKRIYSHLFVRLVKGRGDINDIDWELTDEESIPVIDGYITGATDIPDNTMAATWSETWQEAGKVTRSAPTYISTGKNLGKRNATNMLTQAISEAKSRWDKNARKMGYVTNEADLEVVQSGRIKPMALHSFPPQSIDGVFDISGQTYWTPGQPIFISSKVDGNRLMASIGLTTGSVVKVDLWGRAGDTPPNGFNVIRRQLEALYKRHNLNGLLVFDGEVYRHGTEHQLINGIYMNVNANADDMDYRVFDVIEGSANGDLQADVPFKDRYARLIELFRGPVPAHGVKMLTQTLVSTSAEIERIYKEYLAAGYEGAVLRLPDGPYEAGIRREVRSKYVLKLKPEYDSEFEIVGFKSGAGREAGALIWLLQTADGKQFAVRPKGTIQARRELFAQMPDRFDSDFKGHNMRVAYGDMTAAGVPRFPRGLEVRDILH